ncbi:unnamed protein product [Soboliphyme baturini]|uniref:TIR domain-containing protein n=1 Tax=Soboliphyme baturini TaxID=241478 RepID=A0A183IFE1_9BILA|nr:unnamed protein product [Soboliphyme baturini]
MNSRGHGHRSRCCCLFLLLSTFLDCAMATPEMGTAKALAPAASGFAGLCPSDCHCLEQQETGRLKVTCDWPAITAQPNAFADFPSNTMYSLSLSCNKFKPGMFSSFMHLEHLAISHCRSDDGFLPLGFAHGLYHLKTLDIEDIRLRDGGPFHIQPKAFDSLHKLEKLRLVNSNVGAIAKGMFCRLTELKSLNVSGNAISDFGSMGFDGCASGDNQLMILDVSGNRIVDLAPNAFDHLGNLHVLNMQANGMQRIDERAFQRLEKLQELRLAGNRIVRLPRLPRKLQLLDLSENLLKDIPSSCGGGDSNFENLLQLNLSHNHITSLNHSCFDSAQHLKSVDFSFNQLTTIADGVPHQLPAVEEMYLCNNNIERFEFAASAYDAYGQLVYLDLSHNRIAHVRQPAVGLPRLTTLIFRHNRISSVDDRAFATMPKLRRLNLAENLLSEIPVALAMLSNLSSLDVSRNRLQHVQKFVFDQMSGLQTLTLSENAISTIDRHAFRNCSSLESLDLSTNAIRELSINCFDGVVNLKHLRLQMNALGDIAAVLVNLQRLITLNVSNNQIRSVDFGLLPPGLRQLYASHNRIEVITNFLQSMRPSGVRHADFSFNNLRHLQAHFLPPSLETLNVSHNVIDEITGHLYSQDKANYTIFEIHGMVAVQPIVFLRGNPLSCSCRSQWLSVDSEQSYSGTLKQHNLQRLANFHFLCAYHNLCADDCVCCEFESCDCKSICPAAGCTCLHDFAHKINVVECRHQRRNAVSPRNIPMRATDIFLDGTYFFSLERHAFFGRYRLRQLYLNNSEIYNISPKAFSGLTFLSTLDLSDNFITQLQGDEFFNIPNLSHFYLHNNRISSLSADAFAHMPSLQLVTLHGNLLQLLPPAVASLPSPVVTISLSGNPWKCDCGNRFLLQTWLPANKANVMDSNAVHCQEDLSAAASSNGNDNHTTILKILPPTKGATTVKVNFWTFSNEISKTFCHQNHVPSMGGDGDNGGYNAMVIAIVIIATTAVVLIAALFLLRYGRALRDRIFYRKYLTDLSLDSYSIDDEKFVRDELVSRLEQEAPYFRICMLYRDLSADSFANRYCMADELMTAMEKSQRVITVLTDNFMRREWEQVQIRTSYKYLLRNRQRKLVLVVLDDIPSDTEPILAHYLRTNRCIHWNDPMFWDNLMAAMPQPKHDDVQNASDASHYSDIYGTVVPSDFV